MLRARLQLERDELISSDEPIDVIVEFTGALTDLATAGFAATTVIEDPGGRYTIATGRVPRSGLDRLTAVEHVVRVSHPRQMTTQLDYSVPETRADLVHKGTPPRLGTDVVIGIIDSGIDWRHRDFVDFDDRTSRILGIWDQLLKAEGSETPGPGNVGVVYTRDQISDAVRGLTKIRTGDLGTAIDNKRGEAGHGTHVASIAAGDGSSATCCHAANTYVGMAPRAGIIMVRSDFSSHHIIDGLAFIFNHPEALDKPVVVNMSFGSNLGAHDGLDPDEKAINSKVAARPGRAVVVSAGNSADARAHVRGTIPIDAAKSVTVEFTVFEQTDATKRNIHVDLWYERAGIVDLTLNAPGGASSGVVAHGASLPNPFVPNQGDSQDRQTKVTIQGAINDPDGRDNNFWIEMAQPKKGSVLSGPWSLVLSNRGAAAVTFHCWLSPIPNPDPTVQFLAPVSPPDRKIRASSDSTLTSPGMASGAITVARYESRSGCCDCWPSGDIADSSSRGPLARGAAANPKPDIAAPGLDITAAKADAANLRGNLCDCCPDACCCLYTDMSGTSMSAPHVTGAIALMLEENPLLDSTEIKRLLQASARKEPAGRDPNAWGAGKLDAQAAVLAVRAAAGGGARGLRGPPPGGEALTSFTGGTGFIGELPPQGFASTSPLLGQSLQALWTTLLSLPDGERVVAAACRHFSEIRRLINTNRRVATMWHRANGPSLLRDVLQSGVGGGCQCARAAFGERERIYLDRFLDMLHRYGSPRLRASLDRYRWPLVGLLYEVHVTVPTGA